MDYSRHYQQLIAKHGYATKPDDDDYYERHHVIPKSIGGSDAPDNLVYLTGKAHYVAHYLLFKVHGTGPMANAFWAMSVMNKGVHRHLVNSRSFEVARKAKADTLTGVPRPPEVRAKISKANKGLVRSPEACKALGVRRTDRVASPETRAKMRLAHGGLNHSQVKPADIYCAGTDELIASSVIIRTWANLNGCTPSALHTTAKADRTKPHKCRVNPLYHKGFYALYC